MIDLHRQVCWGTDCTSCGCWDGWPCQDHLNPRARLELAARDTGNSMLTELVRAAEALRRIADALDRIIPP